MPSFMIVRLQISEIKRKQKKSGRVRLRRHAAENQNSKIRYISGFAVSFGRIVKDLWAAVSVAGQKSKFYSTHVTPGPAGRPSAGFSKILYISGFAASFGRIVKDFWAAVSVAGRKAKFYSTHVTPCNLQVLHAKFYDCATSNLGD